MKRTNNRIGGFLNTRVRGAGRRKKVRRPRGGLETLESRLPLAAQVLVNEIHLDPDLKTEPVEFVELWNAGDQSQDLSGWALADAVDFTFPAGTVLPADGYLVVAQDPAAVQQKFLVDSVGPFFGKLSNEGERIALQDGEGQIRDEVMYGFGFPWPTVGDEPGNSFELINPRLDNDLAGSWRSSVGGPTPAAANSQFATNAAPQTRQQDHSPNQPTSSDDVVIRLKVTDPDGVSEVRLDYQIVAPGDYISINDPRYATNWTSVSMRDDGQQGDVDAGDDVYTVTMPSAMNQHRHLVRYRVSVSDTLGASVMVPYADDPVPNFAYFVYDGIPDYTASTQPGVEPSVTHSSETLQQVQVYQLLTTQQEHHDAQQVNGPSIPAYFGSGYPWSGTMIVDGDVFDHVGYRARGGENRYRRGKNAWKFDFPRGHSLQAIDNYGVPYAMTWDNVNLAHIGNTNSLGVHNLNEALSLRLFQLAGVEGPNSHFIHFRIVESADETSENQYATDFRGLYLAVEQPDGRMLDEHGLPDGNLYKLTLGLDVPGDLNNQGASQPSDGSDLVQFIDGYSGRPPADEAWWRDNFDVDRYYSYRSILEAVRHYDVAGTNQLYYHNPETDLWSVHPWDVDLTWRDNTFGNGSDAFVRVFLGLKVFQVEYHNRLREITDLLFNRDQVDMLIDELSSFIASPTGPSIIDADRAMWDHNPILAAAPASRTGLFYQTGATGDFAGMLQSLRDYVDRRTKFIYDRIVRDDEDAPETPVIQYVGSGSFPANGLSFSTSQFASPIDANFAAMQWRIAEVTDPNSQPVDPLEPRKYEIDATWQSEALTEFDSEFTIPGSGLIEGHTYRTRVRMKDDAGVWSHWSEPIQFVVGPAHDPVVQNLRITELNYHPYDPPSGSALDDSQFEFIEFRNMGSQPLDVSGVRITDGVDFTFQASTTPLLEASFATDAEGFDYADDPLGTSNPDYADGTLGEGEELDGALHVKLGPGLDADPLMLVDSVLEDPEFAFLPDLFNGTSNPDSGIEIRAENLQARLEPRSVGAASAGWRREFELSDANTVHVLIEYELDVGQTLESSEFGEAILEVDGQRLGMAENDSLAHLPGKGDSTTGRLSAEFDVSLHAGLHTIVVGVYNNQANTDDEIVNLTLYDLSVTVEEPGATGAASGGWSTTVTLPQDQRVRLDTRYRVVQAASLESSEVTELVLLVDGQRYELGANGEPLRFVGGAQTDSGWNDVRVDTNELSAGPHELTLAVYNSGLTDDDETVDVDWDRVSVASIEPMVLAPNEIALVVADRDAFVSRYGTDARILGEIASGRLSNGGERIVVESAMGNIVQSFTYDDNAPWPTEPDGDGPTLEIINPRGDATAPTNWRASRAKGGTPGRIGIVPGDANHDGVFDSNDLLLVLQAGEFEDAFAQNSTFEEGDWDGDGEFTSSDLVYALQFGHYTGGPLVV